MKELIERIESLSEGNALTKLEKIARVRLKPGRNMILGYPVDIPDQDPDEGLSMMAADKDAAKQLMKELRRKGMKPRFMKRTGMIVLD